jgi:hypothetical protein
MFQKAGRTSRNYMIDGLLYLVYFGPSFIQKCLLTYVGIKLINSVDSLELKDNI